MLQDHVSPLKKSSRAIKEETEIKKKHTTREKQYAVQYHFRKSLDEFTKKIYCHQGSSLKTSCCPCISIACISHRLRFLLLSKLKFRLEVCVSGYRVGRGPVKSDFRGWIPGSGCKTAHVWTTILKLCSGFDQVSVEMLGVCDLRDNPHMNLNATHVTAVNKLYPK